MGLRTSTKDQGEKKPAKDPEKKRERQLDVGEEKSRN